MTTPSRDHREVLRERYSETHANAGAAPTPAQLADLAKAYEAAFAPLLPGDRDARILELGCGRGAFLHWLKSEGRTGAAGVDSDPASVASAKRLGVDAETGDALERLRREPGAWDAVVAIDALEHFRKDELFPLLDAVKAALKPGGVFVWRAPNAESPFFGRVQHGDLTHETAFTRASAFQLMSAAGFDSIAVVGDLAPVTGARSLLRRLLWIPLSAAARVYLWAESCVVGAVLEANLIASGRKP